MNPYLHHLAAAGVIATGFAFAPSPSAAAIRICTFPGSPSTTMDEAVAREVFKTANVAASIVTTGIAGDDDDGVSLKELGKTLRLDCDVIAGFPRSRVADAAGAKLRFSRGYLHAGYVSVQASDEKLSRNAENVVAATYASPAQLIAMKEPHARLDLQNTPELTLAAVADGRAQRAVVWYPALVAYERAHPQQRFDVRETSSPYAHWQLVFAFGANSAALRHRVDTAIAALAANGRLDALTRDWNLPGNMKMARSETPTFAYRDGPAPATVRASSGAIFEAGMSPTAAGRIVEVSDAVPAAPPFDSAQVAHGKSLYSNACAKCHGASLQGVTAPALSGPAFAPAANARLTIGGVYTYMATNMPADRPGKMKGQDYADIMAFLLYSNGYRAAAAKLTDANARSSSTPLNAGPGR